MTLNADSKNEFGKGATINIVEDFTLLNIVIELMIIIPSFQLSESQLGEVKLDNKDNLDKLHNELSWLSLDSVEGIGTFTFYNIHNRLSS